MAPTSVGSALGSQKRLHYIRCGNNDDDVATQTSPTVQNPRFEDFGCLTLLFVRLFLDPSSISKYRKSDFHKIHVHVCMCMCWDVKSSRHSQSISQYEIDILHYDGTYRNDLKRFREWERRRAWSLVFGTQILIEQYTHHYLVSSISTLKCGSSPDLSKLSSKGHGIQICMTEIHMRGSCQIYQKDSSIRVQVNVSW